MDQKKHLVDLIVETLMTLDSVVCQAGPDELGKTHVDTPRKVRDYVAGLGKRRFTFSRSTVYVTLDYQGIVVINGPESIIEAAAGRSDGHIETLLAQLRLYSTRVSELS